MSIGSDGGVPAVKTDLQVLVTLEIFKRQGNKLHFHDCIFLSDLLYCRCTELFFSFARRVCYHPAGLWHHINHSVQRE